MRFKKLLAIIILSLISAFGMLKYFVCLAEEPCPVSEKHPPHVLCYRTASVNIPEKKLEDLKRQLEILEESYKQNKVNSETYEKRKQVILNEIESLENK